MFILRFSDWELIYKLLEQRELQLRQILEADGHRGCASKKNVLKEYKQVCDTMKRLVGPSGRSWSSDQLVYKGPGLDQKAQTRPRGKVHPVELEEMLQFEKHILKSHAGGK